MYYSSGKIRISFIVLIFIDEVFNLLIFTIYSRNCFFFLEGYAIFYIFYFLNNTFCQFFVIHRHFYIPFFLLYSFHGEHLGKKIFLLAVAENVVS